MIATLRKLGGIGALILSTILFAGTASGELLTQKSLSLEDAKKVAAGAAAEARKNKWNLDIAIVDDGGHLIYFERTDGTMLAGADLAIGKARTAVVFQRPTKALEDALNGGQHAILSFPNAVPREGGLLIVGDGKIGGGRVHPRKKKKKDGLETPPPADPQQILWFTDPDQPAFFA